MSEIARRNRIRPQANGPYLVEGDVEVRAPSGETVFEGTRTALCRCGASGNKPFCDGTHANAGLADEGRVKGPGSHRPDPATARGRVVIRATADGPLLVEGSFDLEGTPGREETPGLLGFRRAKAALCACGRSSEKPLCDGTHARPVLTRF